MIPEEYIQRLTETSIKKYKLLQDMLSITKTQTDTINEDGLEELERLVTVKQLKIDEIIKLDDQFNVYFLRLKHEINIKSLDELKGSNIKGLKELQEVTKDIMSIINEISEIEQQNGDKARKLQKHFGDEVKKVNQSRKIHNAYTTSPAIQPPSYFVDKKK